jgi:hypothetical protein
MKLKYVTFTGADAFTSVKELQAISKEYPSVEWGILLSKSGMGLKPRYPDRAVLDAIAGADGLKLSGHLCGAWMRNMIKSGTLDKDGIGPIWDKLSRVQLNFSGAEALASEEIRLQEDKGFILQSGGVPLPLQFNGGKFDVLYDGSGGRGILARDWPYALAGKFCGYAGGLNPENISKQLQNITAAAEGAEFWIDFESGVRTDDKFDLTKVRKILEIIYEK